MVGGGHDLVLSLGLGDDNARTRGLKRDCHRKDGKINNKNMTLIYNFDNNLGGSFKTIYTQYITKRLESN